MLKKGLSMGSDYSDTALISDCIYFVAPKTQRSCQNNDVIQLGVLKVNAPCRLSDTDMFLKVNSRSYTFSTG